MDLTCDADDLSEALGLLNGTTRDLVLAQNSVLISANGARLVLEGVSHGAIARTTVPITTEDPPFAGWLLLDHTRLSGVAGAMQNTIHITVDQNRAKLSSAGLSATFQSIPEQEGFQPKHAVPLFSVDAADLKAAIAAVDHCVADANKGVPALRGIAFDHTDDDVVTVSATNGFASAQVALAGRNVMLSSQVFLPTGALKDAARAMATVDGTVAVSANESMVTLTSGATTWHVRRTEGRLPNLAQFRPKDEEITTRITVDKDDLLAALKTAALFASKADTLQDVIRLGVEDDSLVVRARGSEHGSFEERIEPIDRTGDDIELKVAGQLLKPAIGAVPGDNVVLSFVAPLKPILVTGEESADTDFQIVVPCV